MAARLPARAPPLRALATRAAELVLNRRRCSSAIREFGFDKVKIDRRFISKMDDEDSVSVVRALAGLGQGLGVAVSADVADPSANSALLASGIREGQSSSELLAPEATTRILQAAAAMVKS